MEMHELKTLFWINYSMCARAVCVCLAFPMGNKPWLLNQKHTQHTPAHQSEEKAAQIRNKKM